MDASEVGAGVPDARLRGMGLLIRRRAKRGEAAWAAAGGGVWRGCPGFWRESGRLQFKLDALVAYEAKYLAYSAAITAYNQKVSDKNTLKAAVMESYEIFNPIKTTTVAKFDKDNVVYQKFESGAAKGSCGLSDCEMESVCGYAIAADADYYVEEKRGKCVQKNKDLVEHCHK